MFTKNVQSNIHFLFNVMYSIMSNVLLYIFEHLYGIVSVCLQKGLLKGFA